MGCRTSTSSSSVPGGTPCADPDDTGAIPFPLFELPPELVHQIILHCDERPRDNPTFPVGPSLDLLNLRSTSRYFDALCRPLVWQSVRFEPETGLRPEAFRARRGLRALRDLLVDRQEAEGATGEEVGASRRNCVPQIKVLSVSSPSDSFGSDAMAIQEEVAAIVPIVERLLGLEVLFLKDVSMDGQLGDALLEAIVASPVISALRFNQVVVGNKKNMASYSSLPALKTLQVMHGSRKLLELVRISPNIESLLLWPSSRRLGPLVEVIAAKLPTLRLLSLDAVHEGEAFLALAKEINRLSADGQDLPLTELFLEGPQPVADRTFLLDALSKTNLKRLALYQIQMAKPQLFSEIATALPQLEALTIVQGDCSGAVLWPAPLEAYVAQLQRLPRLKFFGFDRRAPDELKADGTARSRSALEYRALGSIGVGVPSLEEAVAITVDVSEGSSGWFATFARQNRQTHMEIRKKTVHDFLISYDRWCIVSK